MRRAMLAVLSAVVVIAAAGLVDPQPAQAQPGGFSFSIGSPGYYGAGYGYGYAPYAYGAYLPQTYLYGSVPFGGPACGYGGYRGYGGYPYRSNYRGYYGYSGYGHHGHGHRG